MNRKFSRVISAFAATLIATIAVAATAADGEWQCKLSTPDKEFNFSVAVSVDGENATGQIGDEKLSGTFTNGKLVLAGVHFDSTAGYAAELRLSAQVEGDQLAGSASWDFFSGDFKGTRKN